MLLRVENLHKSIGVKDIFEDLSFILQEKEKVGIIGRNGLGKTTLIRILSGEDTEFQGEIEFRKGVRVVMTMQEHFFTDEVTPLDYILNNVPKFRELQNSISLYETLGEDGISLEKYCDAIAEFSEKDYFSLEGKIIQSLVNFQLDEKRILGSMQSLSGGEKRFVELVRVMYSEADIALIDEPTNHMDFVGKAQFITWLQNFDKTVLVITHDRDVLKHVSRILELKDKKISSYSGNYDSYLKKNSLNTSTGIISYEENVKRIGQLKKQINELGRRGAKNRAIKIMEDRFKRELEQLQVDLEKPSFWIDKDSLGNVSDKVIDSYHKYKEKNITIHQGSAQMHKKLLLEIKHLSVGYDHPLFENINIELYYGDKVFVKGRNGAGKSTFVKTIISLAQHTDTVSTVFKGDIKLSSNLKIGVYEQEVDRNYLSLTLEDVVIDLYYKHNLPINQEKVNAILKNYLFDPKVDAKTLFSNLSGGQKARFQLIKMFVDNPNLLILDEPTNHLDLPSIEELENALHKFSGAIVYISHDSYFIEHMGGKVLEIGQNLNS